MMQFSLNEVTRHPQTKALIISYTGRHQNGEGKAVLEFKVTVTQDPPPGFKRNPQAAKEQGLSSEGGFQATINFDGCEGATIETALKRLSEWCSRASETLREFKPEIQIPT